MPILFIKRYKVIFVSAAAWRFFFFSILYLYNTRKSRAFLFILIVKTPFAFSLRVAGREFLFKRFASLEPPTKFYSNLPRSHLIPTFSPKLSLFFHPSALLFAILPFYKRQSTPFCFTYGKQTLRVRVDPFNPLYSFPRSN